MAYCTEANVLGEFKTLAVGATTAISSADITRFIEESDQEIDSQLALKYTVPITGANSLLIMRKLSIFMVKARILRILAVKTGNADAEQFSEAEELEKKAQDIIDKILNAKLILSDASPKTSAQGWRSHAVDEDLEYTFQEDTQQW